MTKSARIGTIDTKIKKKQDELFALKDKCDGITAELQELLKQRDELRKEELLKEFDASERTYEEIIEYLRSAPKRTTSQPMTKRKYKSRKPKNPD